MPASRLPTAVESPAAANHQLFVPPFNLSDNNNKRSDVLNVTDEPLPVTAGGSASMSAFKPVIKAASKQSDKTGQEDSGAADVDEDDPDIDVIGNPDGQEDGLTPSAASSRGNTSPPVSRLGQNQKDNLSPESLPSSSAPLLPSSWRVMAAAEEKSRLYSKSTTLEVSR